MKTAKVVPSVCKGEDATWEGFVVLRLPTFDEKFEYLEKMQISVKDDGTVEGDSHQKLKSVRDMVKISQSHYVEVCLKSKKTGEEVKSFDDMQYVEELHSTLIEVAALMLNGFKVGNA